MDATQLSPATGGLSSAARLPILGKIDSMAFCVATCPNCSERFRLIWRIGKLKLAPSTVIRLTCPTCAHSFTQVAVELVVFSAGADRFPKSVVVDRSGLAAL